MRHTIAIGIIAVMALAGGHDLAAQSGNDLFQQALTAERADGDVSRAIRLYQNIVTRFEKTDRALVAKTLVQLGECYEKSGNAEAKRVYERVVRQYSDQREFATVAERRLSALAAGENRKAAAEKVLLTPEALPLQVTVSHISADGRLAAAVDRSVAPADLAVIDIPSGRTTRLGIGHAADNLPPIEHPVLSPSKRELAYFWRDGKTNQLRLASTTPGGTIRTLVDSPEINGFVPAGWTPDGSALLTAIRRIDQTWQLAWVSVADGKLTVVKSLEWRLLFPWDMVSLSPDGRYIAYSALVVNPAGDPGPQNFSSAEREDQRIYVIAADGSGEAEVVKTPGTNTSPFWSSDGRYVVFTRGAERSSGSVWAVRVQNGKAAELPVSIQTPSSPGRMQVQGVTANGSLVVERDGSRITARIGALGPSNTAGRLERLPIETGSVWVVPVWSPDGKSLAFPQDGAQRVVSLSNFEGRSYPEPDDASLSSGGLPLWRHDGKGLLVPRRTRGKLDSIWYTVDIASGQWRQIPSRYTRSNSAALSNDDRTLYVLGREGGSESQSYNVVLAVDVATGTERVVSTAPSQNDVMGTGPGGGLSLSPDGGRLAFLVSTAPSKETQAAEAAAGFHRAREGSRLAIISTDGKGYKELDAPGALDYSRVAWASEDSILFQAKATGPSACELRRAFLDGRPSEAVGLGFCGDFSLSPDGKRVAFSVAESNRQLLSLGPLSTLIPSSK